MFEGESDRRVRRTKLAVHRALMSLMLERGYDKVTVSAIIERADVGRSTFYAHFTDKQQVLYDSLDELAHFLHPAPASDGPLFGFSLPMFVHAAEQRHVLRVLLGRRGPAILRDRVAHLLTRLVSADLTARTPAGGPTVPPDLVVTGVVGAYLALLSRWLDEDDPRSPREMDGAFRRLVTPGVTAALGLEGD